MRGDEETGIIVATQIIEEEGMSRDSNTNTSGESGSGEFSVGESGRAGDCGEHRETMLEVHQALGTVHHGH